jgi:predicted RNA-binding Zn ribbon-like protein
MEKHPRGPQTGSFLLAPRYDLCLDFANTLGWRGSTSEESLHDLTDVLNWCSSNGGVPAGMIEAIRCRTLAHPGVAMSLFRDAIAIRESIYRVFHALASRAEPSDDDLDALNRALTAAPRRESVHRIRARFGWRIAGATTNASAILASVLWSAGELLVGPYSERVRECANGRCLWLFLDNSKNGSRRWCSMQACGNRAKARRHYLRHVGR